MKINFVSAETQNSLCTGFCYSIISQTSHERGWVNCCIQHYLLYAVTAKCCSCIQRCIQQNQKRIFSYIFVKIALKLALKTVRKNRAALLNCQLPHLSSSKCEISKSSGSLQTTSDDMSITFSKLYLTKS